ncbi:MAG: MFS transporter [Candidatus Hydrogenedentes bacterium]|nr:MFS transporter [Candidatus Hydrogenedentota bacterium]
MEDSAQSVRSRATQTFAAIFVLHAALDCYGGIWPIFKHLAGIPLGYAGFVATSTTMVMWALQPAFGHWADQGRMRLCLLLGTALTFPMMFLGPLGNHVDTLGTGVSFALMILIMGLGRLGQAMFHPAGATVSASLSGKHRATLLSAFIAAGWLGYGASQTVYSVTFFHTGGHTELALLPGLVVFGWAALRCKPIEPERSVIPERAHLGLAPLLKGDMLLLFVVLTLMSSMNQALFFLLPEFLSESHYPEWVVNGGGLVFLVIGAGIAMVPFGYLADRLGQRLVFIVSIILSGVTYAYFVMYPPKSIPGLAALCILTGSVISAVNPLGVSIGQLMAPRNMSAVGGIMMGLAWAVAASSQWVVGYLADRPGSGPSEALAWIALTAPVAAILTFALPRTTPAPASLPDAATG